MLFNKDHQVVLRGFIHQTAAVVPLLKTVYATEVAGHRRGNRQRKKGLIIPFHHHIGFDQELLVHLFRQQVTAFQKILKELRILDFFSRLLKRLILLILNLIYHGQCARAGVIKCDPVFTQVVIDKVVRRFL